MTTTANRNLPVVPDVLIVGERTHPFTTPGLTRACIRYATDHTVRIQRPGGAPETLQQHLVYCLPDDAAWERLGGLTATFQVTLDRYADELREIGSYASRLAEYPSWNKAPNPLMLTVIHVDDPDATYTYWWRGTWAAAKATRVAAVRHTAKMLERPSGGDTSQYHEGTKHLTSQNDYFVCPDDDAWKRVEACATAAAAAGAAVEQQLDLLGHYDQARHDGRHARRSLGTLVPGTGNVVQEALW